MVLKNNSTKHSKKLGGCKKEMWSTYLELCVFAYNTSCQESIKFTPFELMFGRKATISIDIDINKEPKKVLEKIPEYFFQSHYVTLLLRDIQKERAKRLELVKHSIEAAQKKER